MKLTQCDRFKNHYYDGDKYTSCPHCAKLGFGNAPERHEKASKHTAAEHATHVSSPARDTSSDKTVMLTRALYDDEDVSEKSMNEQIKKVGVSGNPEDIKTVAMYGFDTEIDPVTGWVVAISGPEKGKSFEIRSGKNTLGREGAENVVDISLSSDHKVSRGIQAIIIYEPQKREFLLQVSNGSSLVYLNSQLLMEFSHIEAYDQITIGETDLLFVPFCSDRFSWDNE